MAIIYDHTAVGIGLCAVTAMYWLATNLGPKCVA